MYENQSNYIFFFYLNGMYDLRLALV